MTSIREKIFHPSTKKIPGRRALINLHKRCPFFKESMKEEGKGSDNTCSIHSWAWRSAFTSYLAARAAASSFFFLKQIKKRKRKMKKKRQIVLFKFHFQKKTSFLIGIFKKKKKNSLHQVHTQVLFRPFQKRKKRGKGKKRERQQKKKDFDADVD